MSKVNNKDNKKTPTASFKWRGSGVFVANFEHISQLVLLFLLLTLNPDWDLNSSCNFSRGVHPVVQQ